LAGTCRGSAGHLPKLGKCTSFPKGLHPFILELRAGLFACTSLLSVMAMFSAFHFIFSFRGQWVLIKEIVGFSGEISFDKTKPNGTMRKLMSSSKLNSLGWKAKTSLKDGLQRSYEDFKKNSI
jgi:hypothetical protein